MYLKGAAYFPIITGSQRSKIEISFSTINSLSFQKAMLFLYKTRWDMYSSDARTTTPEK